MIIFSWQGERKTRLNYLIRSPSPTHTLTHFHWQGRGRRDLIYLINKVPALHKHTLSLTLSLLWTLDVLFLNTFKDKQTRQIPRIFNWFQHFSKTVNMSGRCCGWGMCHHHEDDHTVKHESSEGIWELRSLTLTGELFQKILPSSSSHWFFTPVVSSLSLRKVCQG